MFLSNGRNSGKKTQFPDTEKRPQRRFLETNGYIETIPDRRYSVETIPETLNFKKIRNSKFSDRINSGETISEQEQFRIDKVIQQN